MRTISLSWAERIVLVALLALAAAITLALFPGFGGGGGSAAAAGGVTRTYYIAADEVLWNYAPTDARSHESVVSTAYK